MNLVRASLILMTLGNTCVLADNYPSQPINIVVTVAPGGGIDVVTRLAADGIGAKLGQPIVVTNHAGAAGTVGAAAVFRAEPDGHTLMATSPTPITIAKFLYKTLTYEPTAFEPVALMSRIPNVLAVRADLPAKSVKELVAYIKSNSGRLTFASQGVGTASHLAGELFKQKLGAALTHVPYKGTGPLINDLVGGHVDMAFVPASTVSELHKQAKVRVLAVGYAERLQSLPDVPTLAEMGVQGADSETWNAISAPPKTPGSVIGKLNAAINEALRQSAAQTRFRDLDMLPGGGAPDQVRKFVTDETRRWSEVVRSAGL